VVALCRRALIILDVRFAGRPIHAGGVVVGIAHPRGGPLGEYRIYRRAGLRVEESGDLAHAVGLLLADGQVPPAGPVDIGEFTVGMYQRHEPVGGLRGGHGGQHRCQ
jgi:hypothetical protein